MTESEWTTCTDPHAMLTFLQGCGDVSERKLRLCAVACCRRVWRLIRDPRYQRVVEVAERYADGLTTVQEQAEALAAGLQAGEDGRQGANGRSRQEYWLVERAYRAVSVLLEADVSDWVRYSLDDVARAEGIEQLLASGEKPPAGDEFLQFFKQLLVPYTAPLRCIFGNPFHPVTFYTSWRTDTVTTLATQMYETRSFETMPILGDALQDAGCDSEEVLAHCRDPQQVHARGCWVVDLVLGKT